LEQHIAPNWFEEWFNSPYYHLLYNNRNETEAEAFISRLITYLQIPAACKLLDIACGKGRHARQLANLGYDVTGIDLASESIAYAKQFETEKLHFFEQDMRSLFHINEYDYAFNFFTSIGYFNTKQEDERTFSNFAAALKPNGFLIIDFINVHAAIQSLQTHQQLTRGDIQFDVTKHYDGTYFKKAIQVTDANLVNTYHEKLRAFTLPDFESMCATNQLSIVKTFGDYELMEYDQTHSPRLILIAKKN
jgi:SAM-dependent methyltransferase